ncbi:hypothetical protein ACJIZ3_020495 [Penstemon smallii]|uniref:Coatomer subunit zeta n=2 Tax=Penstemon TaxID=69923 RepID=A0ABD3SIS3_9LAMI
MRAAAGFSCCSLVLYLFIVTSSLVCVTSSSRSRHFAPNGGLIISAHFNQLTAVHTPQIAQNSNEGMKKRMERVEEEAKYNKEINKIGSRPPSCEHKCYGCMPCEPIQEACPTIKNILLLDSEGKRVAVKYYSDDWPTNNAKLAFEKSIFTKTQKTNARNEAEITMLENSIIVYKFVQDLHFFVTGGDDENELILATVLQGFFDAVTLLLRNNVDQREALENLDLILLCLDEIVDGGIILETDGSTIAGKVATHNLDDGAPLSEQTISQALATAREHLTRSLLR